MPVCTSVQKEARNWPTVVIMSAIEVMRARLSKATELGVPSRDFLKREFDESLAMTCHANFRVVQAGQELQAAVRQLESELAVPHELSMPLATTLGN